MSKMQDLEVELCRIGTGFSGKWTAAVTEIATGEHFGIDEEAVMPTASLVKVPILAALYQDIHDGRRKLDERTTYEAIHKCGGSGVLQHLAPGTQMTVRDAAMLMIIISDNAATNMCIDLVGIERVNAAFRQFGLGETALYQRLGEGKAGLDARKMSVSSARDICGLMARIARHEIISPDACDDMLRIMRRLNGRAELSHNLPWNEMNMLPDPRDNWVAEKGGAFINGIRCGGAVFHSTRGFFSMAVFGEGMLDGRADSDSEGNRLLWQMGETAWNRLAGLD
jgi:hypothetical protein